MSSLKSTFIYHRESNQIYKYNILDSGVPEIAEHIFSYLDYNDLKNAELVCKLWYNVIRNGRNWRRCLDKVCFILQKFNQQKY